MKPISSVVALATLPCCISLALAEPSSPVAEGASTALVLDAVSVEASADASAEGLAPEYAGGQVASGSKLGILGNRSQQDTPFSTTSYTHRLIQDRQARSVADVLQNDPSVRMGRGFGNFQETYFVRGFILFSDDIAYNGLYGLLPRQYIASEFFERVELLRGASTFLTGAAPSGTATGGHINLVPKRAPSEPLAQVTLGAGHGEQTSAATDLALRFGPEQRFGLRLNAVTRGGDTAVDDEHAALDALLLGVDWRGDRLRLSADVGWQDNRMKRTRPSVRVAGLSRLPDAPDGDRNWSQDWTYSNERDLFGTVRAEYDLHDRVTAWAAYGLRESKEKNSLANLEMTDAAGAATQYRFDNAREDSVQTGEAGVRGWMRTGQVNHELVVSASWFESEERNAVAMDFNNLLVTDLYRPVRHARPDFSSQAWIGGDLHDPGLLGEVSTRSVAVGDTLSMLDDRLQLIVGLRHQRITTRDFDYSSAKPSGRYSSSRNSPALGVIWQLDPEFALYANYVENLAKGATAPADAVNAGETLQPYVSRQKELGIKYDGGRLGGTLSLFSTTRQSGQMNQNDYFSASGEDRHQGVELGLFGEATSTVRVLGGVTWMNAEQRDTGSAGQDGKRVIGVPRWQGNLGAEWDVPGVVGLTLDARMVYTGTSFADGPNTLRVPAWMRYDAGVRYMTEIAGRFVALRARVENIADRDYWATVGGYPGNGYLTAGAPRAFWLSATVDF